MSTRFLVPSLFVAVALGLSGPACKGKSGPDTFVYVSPDAIGKNPFLTMGKAGIEEAAKLHGAEAKTFESEDPTTRRENMRQAVAAGAKIVAVLGYQFNDMIVEFAEKHPKVQFLMVDHCVGKERPQNLHCAVFREYEATFLLGAEAASLSKSNHIGVVCAQDTPHMRRFTDGYTQGAKHVQPEIKVDVRWVGGQNPYADPVRAKEHALSLHAAGADIIFAATAAGDFGIFEAAAEKDFRVMGVDINHCPAVEDRMYDTALKLVDVAIEETINKILAGEKKIDATYGLKEGGTSVIAVQKAGLSASKCLVAKHKEVVARIRRLKDEIVAGKIAIRDPMFAK